MRYELAYHLACLSAILEKTAAESKAHYNAPTNLVYCISLFALIPLGFHYHGIVGTRVAIAAGDLPVYFVVLYAAYRERVGTLLQDALMTVAFVMTLPGALTLRAALGFGQPFQEIH